MGFSASADSNVTSAEFADTAHSRSRRMLTSLLLPCGSADAQFASDGMGARRGVVVMVFDAAYQQVKAGACHILHIDDDRAQRRVGVSSFLDAIEAHDSNLRGHLGTMFA